MTKKDTMDRKVIFSIIDGGLSKPKAPCRWESEGEKTTYPEAHYRENLKKLAYAFQDFQHISSDS
ncbi:MAG: hypothetical protein ACTSXV_01530 [Alphaproteobacteria bacterium]